MASYGGTTLVKTNGYQKLVLPYKINTEAERDVLFTTKIKITLQFNSEQPNTSCSFIFDVLNWNYENLINSSTTRASLVYNASAKTISWGVLDSSPSKALTGYVKTALDKFSYSGFDVGDKLTITLDFLNKVIRFDNLTKSTAEQFSISDLVFSTVTKSRREHQSVTLFSPAGGAYDATTDKLLADIFLVEIYENETLKNYFSPYKCSENHTGVLVNWNADGSLIEIVEGNDNKTPFSTGESSALNLRSFIELVVEKFKKNDGEFLNDAHKKQLRDYLLYGISTANLNKLINYTTAYDVYRKINKLRGVSSSASYTASKYKVAVSDASARCFIDKVFKSLYSYFYEFQEFDTEDLSDYNVYFVGPPTQSFTFRGTLYGGGGGGSGAISGDGDKNASYTVIGGNGAAGTSTTITIGSESYTAQGGEGGVGPSQKVGGNPTFATAGKNGSNGKTLGFYIVVYGGDKVHIDIVGLGGGGGGACVASAGGTTGGVTYTGGHASGTAGGNATIGANEWSDADYIFGGGGGCGANLQGYNDGEPGVSGSLGPVTAFSSSSTSIYDGDEADYSSTGGQGGYLYNYDDINHQPYQSSTPGLGGTGGTAKNATDVYNLANGGNGGNAGGFVVDTTCEAATALCARY